MAARRKKSRKSSKRKYTVKTAPRWLRLEWLKKARKAKKAKSKCRKYCRVGKNPRVSRGTYRRELKKLKKRGGHVAHASFIHSGRLKGSRFVNDYTPGFRGLLSKTTWKKRDHPSVREFHFYPEAVGPRANPPRSIRGWHTSYGDGKRSGYTYNDEHGDFHIFPSIRRGDGYLVRVADSTGHGRYGAGFWHDVGRFRSPQAAASAAWKFSQR